MKILEGLVQGSEAWLAARTHYNCASEASAMMGQSPNLTRNRLLQMKAIGHEQEFSAYVQEKVFARGHEVEALARPLAAEIIGDDLFSLVGVDDEDYLLASFDGITLLGDVVWECKQHRDSKVADVRAGRIPEEDYWQCIQQLYVSGAERLLYTVSDGTPERTVHAWLESNESDNEALLNGWRMFDEERAAYRHVDTPPPPLAAVQPQLPAVSVIINGSVAVIDNLKVFGDALTDYVSQINKSPQTDDDFATLEATVKTLKSAEEALTAAENSAMAQTESIDTLRRVVAQYRDLARSNRLVVEKLVKSEKENRRATIIQRGKDALAAHIAALNKRLGRAFMPPMAGDFAGKAKGLKTIDSLNNAIDSELARCKIEANATADEIQLNLDSLKGEGFDWRFLFPDLASVCTKAADDFAALLGSRIAVHEMFETDRIEKIRAETEEKLRQEAEDRRKREEAEAKRLVEAEAARQAPERQQHEAAAAHAARIEAERTRQQADVEGFAEVKIVTPSIQAPPPRKARADGGMAIEIMAPPIVLSDDGVPTSPRFDAMHAAPAYSEAIAALQAISDLCSNALMADKEVRNKVAVIAFHALKQRAVA